MYVNNDTTNTFEFFGVSGIGPGKHTGLDIMSSWMLGDIAQKLNFVSEKTFYANNSSQGHYSMFFGSVIIRNVDGTFGGFIENNTSNFGINLEKDSTAPPSFVNVFNDSSSCFEIPLNEELVFENFDPYVRLGVEYDNTALYRYRPQLRGFDYDNGKVLQIYLYNCFDGTLFDSSDFSSLGDGEIKLTIFGTRTVSIEEL
jgi:hypothetical protein